MTVLGILFFVLALLLAIVFHEAGHFATAKLFGIRVERFFVGFGPTLWSVRRGETEYGLKAFPLGGFCKISGMSPYEHDATSFLEEDRRKPGTPPPDPCPPERQFRNKPAWQRAIVLAAGSATHFIAAFLLLYLMLVGIGTEYGTNQLRQVSATMPATGEQTPAARAGLRPGDRIVALDGQPVRDFNDLHRALEGKANQEVTLAYERGGTLHEVRVRLGTNPEVGSGTTGFLGVLPEVGVRRADPLTGVAQAGSALGELLGLTFQALGDLPEGIARRLEPGPAGGSSEDGLVGIVGIGRLAGQAAAADQWLSIVLLMVQLNVFVGVFNLLPLPPLDGGYLAFVLWEKLSGRAVDLRKVAPVALLVFGLLVMLTVGLVWLDITNPVDNPFN